MTSATHWLHTWQADPLAISLAAEWLVAVRQKTPTSAPKWLETCFHIAYRPLVCGQSNPFADTPWKPSRWDWDLARNWREWLVSEWLTRGWAADVFLRAVSSDRRLLDECCWHIRHERRRWEFVEDLARAARSDGTLSSWLPVLAPWRERFRPWWE